MNRPHKLALAGRRAPLTSVVTATDVAATPIAMPTADPIAAVIDQVEAELPRLLTPEEVAVMLGLTERTLERWRITGEGPRYSKLSRSTVHYLREDVAAFIADRLRANTSQ